MALSDQSDRPFWVMFGTHPLPSGLGPPANRCASTMPPNGLRGTVALGTMAERIHQISAAIPLLGASGIRRERLAVKKQEFPDTEIATDIEGKLDVVIAHLADHGRQGFQVGEQILQIRHLRMLIGCIGKRRKVVRLLRRGPLRQRRHEIGFAPTADAVFRIGRDVRRVERPERGKESLGRRRVAGDQVDWAPHDRTNSRRH